MLLPFSKPELPLQHPCRAVAGSFQPYGMVEANTYYIRSNHVSLLILKRFGTVKQQFGMALPHLGIFLFLMV